MADQSLDQYIAKQNIRVQINNQKFGSALRGRLGTQNQNGGNFSKTITTNINFNKGNVRPQQQNRPLQVTVNNPGAFDARTKLSSARRPVDARAKISRKTIVQDARQKIGQKSAIRPVTAPGALSDARSKIGKNRPTVTLTGINTNTGGNRSVSGQMNLQITRKIPAAQVTSSGGLQITRPGNKNTDTSLQFGNPKIQVKNDLYVPSARASFHHTSLNRSIDSFDGDYDSLTEQEVIVSPVKRPNFTIEKTLSVKMPDLPLSRGFTKTIVNRTETVKPTAVSPIASSAGIKRRAASVLQIPEDDQEDAEEDIENGSPAKVVGGPLKLSGGPLTLRSSDDELSPSKKAKTDPSPVKPVASPVKPVASPVKIASKTGGVAVQGIRVVITNLHTIVTQDDIIELFGSIGPMKKARLLTNGSAEIIYLNREDANQAVAKYHNRELDGQAMQVKIMSAVTKAVKAPATKSVASPVAEKGEPLKLGQSSGKGNAEVELSTLHHALFKSGSSSSTPVTFTVKI